MSRKMLSILSMATLVLATSIDAAAYSKSGKAEVRFTGAGNGVTVTCDLSLTTCFTDGKKIQSLYQAEHIRYMMAFPAVGIMFFTLANMMEKHSRRRPLEVFMTQF